MKIANSNLFLIIWKVLFVSLCN